MPYVVIKVKDGWKVRSEFKDASGRYKYFSKKGLTKSDAEAQQKALYAAEGRKKK